MQTNHTAEEIFNRFKSLPEAIVPESGDKYYYLDFGTPVEYTYIENSYADQYNVKIRNAFANEADAIAHAEFREWLFSQPKMTLAECWKIACYDDELAPDEVCAKHFIKLAKENGHI